MKFGISFFATDTTLQPVALARAVEERGFESLWLSEHSHIPTSRETPWGRVPDAPPLPDRYSRTHDSFVALAAAAAVTERILLGTAITLLAQRDPIWTAKEVASLDVVSNGRVVFGVGYGWNTEEMASHGVEYGRRRALLREKLLMMKSLWTDEVASFEGDLLTLAPSWAWPKPVQKPHPPIILGGGAGPRTMADIVELCDGWIPLGRHELDEGVVAMIKRALADAGRDPDAFDLTYFGAPPEEAAVERLERLGFTRALFTLPSDPPAETIDRLDEIARFAESRP